MKKPTTLVSIVALVAIVLVFWLLFKKQHKTASTAVNQVSQQSPSTSAPVQKAATQPSNPLHKGLTYSEALNTYQYRIQFSQCHGAVGLTGIGSLSIKKGTPFMLDNRDPVAHTFAFNGQSYKVGANDFAIVSAIKAGTYPVTCDGGGAASLSVS